MNKEQAAAFLAGLNKLEGRYVRAHTKYGAFKHCAFVFRNPITNELAIKPMCDIEKETELWEEIQQLFLKVINEPRKE